MRQVDLIWLLGSNETRDYWPNSIGGANERSPARAPLAPWGHVAVSRPCNFSHHSRLSKTAKLTFAAAAFAKTSLCAAPAVQALAKNLVGPQAALLVAVALSVGVQDGLVQGCLGKVISLKRNEFNYGPEHCTLQVNSLIICTMVIFSPCPSSTSWSPPWSRSCWLPCWAGGCCSASSGNPFARSTHGNLWKTQVLRGCLTLMNTNCQLLQELFTFYHVTL